MEPGDCPENLLKSHMGPRVGTLGVLHITTIRSKLCWYFTVWFSLGAFAQQISGTPVSYGRLFLAPGILLQYL